MRNLIITNNVAAGDGGALYLQSNNSPTIINVIFSDNFASEEGGAIFVESSNGLSISNSLFINNQGLGGGAIHTNFVRVLNVTNSTFYNNRGGNGDSIFTSRNNDDRPTIVNNIFADNSGIERTQIAQTNPNTNLTISNNIINGSFPTIGNNNITGENNITNEEPIFVDPENNDFRLQTNSPGIDAGDNEPIDLEEDIIGNPRIFNDIIDIGAYEYGVLMSINDVTVEEGDEGTTNAEFVVTVEDTLGEPPTEEITVNYAVVGDTAVVEEDYTLTEGTLTFSAGESIQRINVPIVADERIEGDNTFFVELSGVTGNAEIADSRGVGIITNDDPRREITISDAEVEEGDEGETTLEFTLSLDSAYVEDITVDYNLIENLAIPGEDYTDAEGTVTFAPGETEQTISVDILADSAAEGDETFFVQLDNPSNSATIEDDRATGTIINDDDATELFRFRNTTLDSGTYIFVGEAERGFILNDENLSETFALDGVPEGEEPENANPAFNASTEEQDGLIPFFRLESLTRPGTFLFVSTAEYEFIFDDPIQQEQWKKQGFADEEETQDIPEFYLLDGSADTGTTFNRFQNLQNGTFLYAGPGETEAIDNDPNLSNVFVNQGVAFKSL